MKIRYVIAAAMLAAVAACSTSPTAVETHRQPTSIARDEVAPPPPPDTTGRGGGVLGSGN